MEIFVLKPTPRHEPGEGGDAPRPDETSAPEDEAADAEARGAEDG